jgi:hypothetical protein
MEREESYLLGGEQPLDFVVRDAQSRLLLLREG